MASQLCPSKTRLLLALVEYRQPRANSNNPVRETLLAPGFTDNTGQSTLTPRCGGWHCQGNGLQLGSSLFSGGLARVPPAPPTRPVCGDDWLRFPCPTGWPIDRGTRDANFRMHFPPRSLDQAL
ncbi:exo-alpha-sialidase [Trypanosoma cruzi]|nr:exo-alpha-sialidase [Trypanosoma cruzi]